MAPEPVPIEQPTKNLRPREENRLKIGRDLSTPKREDSIDIEKIEIHKKIDS